MTKYVRTGSSLVVFVVKAPIKTFITCQSVQDKEQKDDRQELEQLDFNVLNFFNKQN